MTITKTLLNLRWTNIFQLIQVNRTKNAYSVVNSQANTKNKPDSSIEIERFETQEHIEIVKDNLKMKVLLKAFETKKTNLLNHFLDLSYDFQNQNIQAKFHVLK